MKKIVLLLIACISFAYANAQMSDASLYFKYTGLATDTVSQTRTWSYSVKPNSTYALYYDFVFKLTEVVATTQTAIALQARKFDTDSWSTITTINYKGTGSDTTFYYTQESTKQFYNEWRFLITPTSGKVKPSFIKGYFRK